MNCVEFFDFVYEKMFFFSLSFVWTVGCSKSYILESNKEVEVSSPGFPANFPNDKDLTCTFFFSTAAGSISISFYGKTVKLDSQASLIVNCFLMNYFILHQIIVLVCFVFNVTKFPLFIYRSTKDPQLYRL